MIYVFYNNDPLAQDQGGGAEHFRCLHRALLGSGLPYLLVAARLQVSFDRLISRQDILEVPRLVTHRPLDDHFLLGIDPRGRGRRLLLCNDGQRHDQPRDEQESCNKPVHGTIPNL